jgi:hypothetical protein
VDCVLFGEFLGEWETELVEVGECVLDYLRAGCAAEEEGGFGVFGGFRGFFFEGTFGSRVAGFAGTISIILPLKLH